MDLPDLPDIEDLERGRRIAQFVLDQAAPIAQTISRWRTKRAERQVEQILERTGFDDQGLAYLMGASEAVSALVEEAIETGARTAHDEKRWMLAAVVAEALAGGKPPTDHHRQLLRTVAEIEPADVHFLARFRATSREDGDQVAQEAHSRNAPEHAKPVLLPEAVEGWPGESILTMPTVAALIRAGLLVSAGRWDSRLLELTQYGETFLEWLAEDPSVAPYFAPPT